MANQLIVHLSQHLPPAVELRLLRYRTLFFDLLRRKSQRLSVAAGDQQHYRPRNSALCFKDAFGTFNELFELFLLVESLSEYLGEVVSLLGVGFV